MIHLPQHSNVYTIRWQTLKSESSSYFGHVKMQPGKNAKPHSYIFAFVAKDHCNKVRQNLNKFSVVSMNNKHAILKRRDLEDANTQLLPRPLPIRNLFIDDSTLSEMIVYTALFNTRLALVHDVHFPKGGKSIHLSLDPSMRDLAVDVDMATYAHIMNNVLNI